MMIFLYQWMPTGKIASSTCSEYYSIHDNLNRIRESLVIHKIGYTYGVIIIPRTLGSAFSTRQSPKLEQPSRFRAISKYIRHCSRRSSTFAPPRRAPPQFPSTIAPRASIDKQQTRRHESRASIRSGERVHLEFPRRQWDVSGRLACRPVVPQKRANAPTRAHADVRCAQIDFCRAARASFCSGWASKKISSKYVARITDKGLGACVVRGRPLIPRARFDLGGVLSRRSGGNFSSLCRLLSLSLSLPFFSSAEI